MREIGATSGPGAMSRRPLGFAGVTHHGPDVLALVFDLCMDRTIL